MKEELLNSLKKLNKRAVIINQKGFLKTQFYIETLCYKIVADFLELKDEKNDIYLNLNINQIYKMEKNDGIILYVDNDTIIEIKE